MNRAKIVICFLLLFVIAIIVIGGCSNASFGSGYSSGPTSAGEGGNMKTSTTRTKAMYGTVAGGGGTGAVTSGGSTGEQYGRG